MTILVISPDYASHYLPLGAVVQRLRAGGVDVVVATGTGLRGRVEADGHRWAELQMSAGNNPGVRAAHRTSDDLRPFLAATRSGMVATLRHQADARAHDLLWQPERVARSTMRLVDDIAPDAVLVDHLAVAARLGLYAMGVPTTSFVPGHPSQLPVAGEVYGFPVAWPRWVRPGAAEMGELRATCDRVSATLARLATSIVRTLDPRAEPVIDAFDSLGATVLYNSPSMLRDPARVGLPARHHFLGSCVRQNEALDDESAEWIARQDPFVYVSLGTFLSARDDVLRRLVDALILGGRRVAMAVGSTALHLLGELPRSWLVRPYLPQIELIAHAALVVCHGGNNTVTEALTAGKPLLVLPFSTDQFAIAADIERAGVGVTADPNAVAAEHLLEHLATLDTPAIRERAQRAAKAVEADGGVDVAATCLTRSARRQRRFSTPTAESDGMSRALETTPPDEEPTS